ncbi:MAG: NPXTG-anchored protein [Ruminococcaceae bacterium]|nr:NPXTG-anchored protein [Oscillospiraceae bacterium]
MKIKKIAVSFLAAAMAFSSAASVAVTSSAVLVPSENPEPGLTSTANGWYVQLYNRVQSIEYDIDYSKVAKYSVTFTVAEEDRDFWDGTVGGGLVLSINGGDIPMYVTDENGDPVYETDENGDIVYLTDNETGEFLLDENGDKIPQKKPHPLYEKYNWQHQTWWGVSDEELGLEFDASNQDLSPAEKVGDYTYKLTTNEFVNPFANGDVENVDVMQICFVDYVVTAIARARITNVDVMDSSNNVLISFDGDGKTNTENTAATGVLETVTTPAVPLIETNSEHWYVLGYETRKTFDQNPEVGFNIDYSKAAKLSATLTVVEEDRDIFDGECAGSLALSISGGDIRANNKELWDKYIWQENEWWGVKDDALDIDKQAAEKDMVSEKIGDYTYKITSKVFDNPLANGDTQEIDHMLFGVQEWGDNKAKMRVVQLDVMDSSGTVLLSYDANGNATIPDTSVPDTSVPDSSIPTPSVPDTSIPDTSDGTSSTPENVVEFVPTPVVDETLDEETAKVITEIKVYAPETAFETGTALTVKKDDSVDGENIFAIDITFTLDGSPVQPKGGAAVTVSVPVPPKFKNISEDLLKVYHFLNGKYTRVEATVSNGTVTFETTHFSTYVISPDDLDANDPTESAGTVTPENSTSVPETSNPHTGVAAIAVFPAAALAGAVVIITKKKK